MGLDSLELLIEWEFFFEITIPDIEAERIGTIQNATDYISTQIKFHDRGVDIKSDILKRLTTALFDLNVTKLSLSVDQNIFDIVPITDQKLWKEISEKINFELPLPFLTGTFGKFIEKIFPSKINFEGTSIDRFVDLICAVNYKKLLIKGQIQNKFEVLIGVMGFTIDKIGVNPFEVFVDSHFVNDLGVS